MTNASMLAWMAEAGEALIALGALLRGLLRRALQRCDANHVSLVLSILWVLLLVVLGLL